MKVLRKIIFPILKNIEIRKAITATQKLFGSVIRPEEAVNDENNILKSPFPDVKIPNVPLSNFIWEENAKLRGQVFCFAGCYNWP